VEPYISAVGLVVEDRTCWPAAADGHRLDRATIGQAGSPPPI
jgi:hypothetical protein